MSSHEIFQKMNEWIRLYYFDTSGRLVFVHFLEEIEDTKKTFRNYLTFRPNQCFWRFEIEILSQSLVFSWGFLICPKSSSRCCCYPYQEEVQFLFFIFLLSSCQLTGGVINCIIRLGKKKIRETDTLLYPSPAKLTVSPILKNVNKS